MNAPALPKAEVAGEGLTEEAWLSLRDTGIGGSEVAGILGESPWDSPYSVWARKRGELPALEETDPMKWGKALEQAIAAEWSADSGITSIQPHPITIYRSVEQPLALSSPDRLTEDLAAWIEVKNVGHWCLEMWDEGIPPYYWIQAQFQLAVSGLECCHVVALAGGQDLRWRRVLADPAWQAMAFDRVADFWKLIESGEQPEIDGSDGTRKALSARYMHKTTDAVEGGPQLALLVAEYLTAQQTEKDATSAKKLAQNRMIAILREHELGTVNGKPFVSNKLVYRGGYEVGPGESPRLTVLKAARA